jgi:hypothetical protein
VTVGSGRPQPLKIADLFRVGDGDNAQTLSAATFGFDELGLVLAARAKLFDLRRGVVNGASGPYAVHRRDRDELDYCHAESHQV